MSLDQPKNSQFFYEIQVGGRISPGRSEWFGGLACRVEGDEAGRAVSILSGPIPDQSALFGVLNRIRDLGLRLIAVNPVPPAENGNQGQPAKQSTINETSEVENENGQQH